MLKLLRFLDTIFPLSEDLQHFLLYNLQERALQKGEKWLREGQVCNYVAFLEKGRMQCLYKKNGRFFTNWVMREQDVFLSVASFFERSPSTEVITAIVPSSIFYISFEQWKYLCTTYPEFREITITLLIRYYLQSENRTKLLRLTPSERVRELKETDPWMMEKLTSRLTSSYLGITEQHFSVLKGNLNFRRHL